MFERFTASARRAVVLAQEEARMLSHSYIDTEHILLGLIREGEGVAAKVLESLGISLEAARAQVEEIIGQGQQAPSGHLPFTPRAKKVLELSLREALQLGHSYIDTEHILLGLIREGQGIAAGALQDLDVALDRVRHEVATIIGLGDDSIGLDVQATLADAISSASNDRIRRAARVAAKVIAGLPASQRVDALSRAHQAVVRSLIEEEVRTASGAELAEAAPQAELGEVRPSEEPPDGE